MSPRSRTNVQTQPAHPAPKAAEPSGAPAAAALHRRVKPGRVLDLRQAKPHMPAPEPIVQPPHHEPAPPPKTTAHERHLAHFSDRFEKAKQIGQSPHIKKFGNERLVPKEAEEQVPAENTHVHPHEAPLQELPQIAETHHQAMARLTPNAPADALPTAPDTSATWRPHLDLSPKRSRVAATVVAVAIMGGYIWLQNYPKLALQNASNKAGVAASLPGYLPSSYSLTRTDTSSGLVTLNFSSPSINEALKIAEARTTWDSSSLLDNFVAKNTDDYATIQGQGLTIYLFGQNRATWVNRGIWFSIEGTGRLSREQILKMAFSL